MTASPIPGSAALSEDYRRAGFCGRLGFGARSALLVVDAVQAYLDPESALYAGPGAIAAAALIADLAATARRHDVPVVFTLVSFRPDGLDGGLFTRKVPALRVFTKGSPLAELPDLLRPGADDLIVTKNYASAFFGTSLASTLHSLAVDTVLVTGFTTSGCVRASATDALNHGFAPLVVRDAVADRSSVVHEANLFDLDAKYADVISSREVKDHLRTAAAR